MGDTFDNMSHYDREFMKTFNNLPDDEHEKIKKEIIKTISLSPYSIDNIMGKNKESNSNWVDINDDLPKINQKILACGWDCGKDIRSGKYSVVKNDPHVDNGVIMFRFKYWQPAPEVPQEIREKFQR